MPKKNIRRNEPSTIWGESIILYPLYDFKEFAFKGIGKVTRISKGEQADMVYVLFYPMAKGDAIKPRVILVSGNHPRRQLLTLKCGQYAEFYGKAIKKPMKHTRQDGRIVDSYRWEMFAYAIQGWYVPNMFDVKKAHKDKVDEELFTDMSENESKLLNDIIDDLIKNRGDENE